MAAVLEDIVFQHAEDACALWHRRSLAVLEPHYDLADLLELDSRVTANIHGLQVAGNDALTFVSELIEAQDNGAVFTNALLALESGNKNLFEDLLQAIDFADSEANAVGQVASALAWVRPGLLAGVVKDLLCREDSVHSMLGLLACTAHGKTTQKVVAPHLESSESILSIAAVRAAANGGLVNLLPVLQSLPNHEEVSVQYEHDRALVLLGDKSRAVSSLAEMIDGGGEYSQEALKLYLQVAGAGECKAILKLLDGTSGRERDVVMGFGAFGDPVAIPWLIGKMEDPLLNRIAGESISLITGVDMLEQRLDTDIIPNKADGTGPNDDPSDDNVTLDEDEDLPWCNSRLVHNWWRRNSLFLAGTRYLAGQPRTIEGFHVVLKEGLQRQRKIAALNVAIMDPMEKYLDTELPARRQLEMLR